MQMKVPSVSLFAEKMGSSSTLFYLSHSEEYKKLSELQATLIAFNEPADKYARFIEHPLKKNLTDKFLDHSQHPICRFPARLMFLKAELSEAKEYWKSLPQLNCLYQNIFLEAIDAASISFVFSSYYSGNPGSAFGLSTQFKDQAEIPKV